MIEEGFLHVALIPLEELMFLDGFFLICNHFVDGLARRMRGTIGLG
jgi:hypothetical protein